MLLCGQCGHSCVQVPLSVWTD